DVDVARTFDQRADITVVLAAEGAEGIARLHSRAETFSFGFGAMKKAPIPRSYHLRRRIERGILQVHVSGGSRQGDRKTGVQNQPDQSRSPSVHHSINSSGQWRAGNSMASRGAPGLTTIGIKG